MLFGGDTGANSIAVGYDFKKTKGTAFIPSYWAGTAPDDTRGYAISIRDDGTGYIPSYINNTTIVVLFLPLLFHLLSTM